MKCCEVLIDHFLITGDAQLQELPQSPARDVLASSLADIERRWRSVSSKVRARQACIEKLLPLSREYSECVELVLPWMTTANREVKVVLPIASDQENLTQQKRVIEVRLLNSQLE